MKKTSLIVLAILSAFFGSSLPAQNNFINEYSAPGFVQSCYNIRCYDGGYMVLNYHQNPSSQEWIAVIKTDSLGTIQWTKTFGPVHPFIHDVAQTTDSCYVLCYVEFASPGYRIVKLDPLGNIIYSQLVSGNSGFSAIGHPQILAKNSGGYYIAGDLFNSAAYVSYWHLMEFDAGGNLLWTHCYHPTPSNQTLHLDFDTCSNGDLVIMGEHRDSTNSPYNVMVARIAPGGALVWSWRFKHTSFFDEIYASSIVAHDNGQITVVGYILNAQNSLREAAIIQLAADGSDIWSLIISANVSLACQESYGVEHSSTVVYGNIKSFDRTMFKIDSAGFILAGRKYPSTIESMSVNTAGYTFTGINAANGRVTLFTTDQLGVGCNDTALVITKTPLDLIKATGIMDTAVTCTTTSFAPPVTNAGIFLFTTCSGTSIEEEEELQASIYPVPAREQLIVVTAYQPEWIEVFDVTGHVVYSSNARATRTEIDITAWAPGMYLVRWSDGTLTGSRKILVE